MGAMPECPWNRAGKKLMGKKKKEKKSPPSPHSVSLSLLLCSTERLIRTCHRSNEYHLNCFVYGSEFGCRFNLRMCLSSCAWRGGRTESGSPNETPASVTGWRGPTRSDGFEKKFWQGGGGRECNAHTHAHTHTHTHTHTHARAHTQAWWQNVRYKDAAIQTHLHTFTRAHVKIKTQDTHLCQNINVCLFACKPN